MRFLSLLSLFLLSLASSLQGGEAEGSSMDLSKLVWLYHIDPEVALSNEEMIELTLYAKASSSPIYASLSKEDRNTLILIINQHADRFPPGAVTVLNQESKLKAGLSPSEVLLLERITDNIQRGQVLTQKEIAFIKQLEDVLLQEPSAFIPELPLLTEYASFNPDSFSQAELTLLKKASLEALGLSEQDIEVLEQIAAQNDSHLNKKQLSVLTNLAVKAPLGALNGLDPAVVLALYQALNAKTPQLSDSALSQFNSAIRQSKTLSPMIPAN